MESVTCSRRRRKHTSRNDRKKSLYARSYLVIILLTKRVKGLYHEVAVMFFMSIIRKEKILDSQAVSKTHTYTHIQHPANKIVGKKAKIENSETYEYVATSS